jgi:Double zinc ribbon
MSFRNEVGIIHKVVWVLAAIVYIGVLIGLMSIAIPQFPPTSHLSRAGMALLGLFAAAIPAIYILLLGYIYGDAKRRGMRPLLWVLLAIFIPNAIGIILYFILRDPKLVLCPACGGRIKSTFTFCPQCATSLRPTCPQCKQPVERSWSHCPHCGSVLGTANVLVPPGQPSPRPL